MKKRATETRILPDPGGYSDWRTWARHQNSEIQRQLLATSMVLPFFEFATVTREADFALTGAQQLFAWDALVYDNTTGGNPPVWDAGDPSYLYVPKRPGDIQYGWAMLIACLTLEVPAVLNDVRGFFNLNDASAAPIGSGTARAFVGTAFGSQVLVYQPWVEVNPGDFFPLYVTRSGAGDADIDGGIFSWGQIVLAGPA